MAYKILKESQIEVKKSKFLGFLYEIENSDDVSKIHSKLLKEHKKANHICFGGLTKDENFLKMMVRLANQSSNASNINS